ncbi:sugar-binding protein [Chryseobacterium lactis]|uniref:RHS repeat-associated core domain-containing protein n=1 Tax=Chryseobacterium lactis TaxID=1241981 RepID=A0A3G6RVC8_CHRLC|nr:DUF6443 domain-containing protein [Chryseobacterium lactis]AZA80842.1 RHS repeat-associated core domain-containing protein [Chryseobacterium lactis]AZB05844.1 RHS repeat-associated core domain-containing protein [Chryseobacterium lactis]PNW13436.1 sugar-binding protein [Chryseobacterium lactis]
MKKILNIFSILFVAVLFNAQTTTENYIQSTTCLDADCIKKAETVQYFDFLGRPKQVINVKSSPTGKDIVTPIVYDDLGRQTKGYLPIPQSGTQNGDLYTSPLNNASSIYGAEKIYSEKILDNSPLERVLQQKQVGNDWNSKSVAFGYDLNNSPDHVKKYDLVTAWNPTEKLYNNTLQPASEYQAGQLIKNSVTDEDGNTTVEFKDGSGQTVLIRKVMSTSRNADTYYVYNDYKLLTYVIPPLASSGTLDAAVIDNLCYQYKYDSKNRLVEKKLPGKGWEYMVYDKQDRLVLSQDALLGITTNSFAAKGWMFSKYDQFGRVAYTGFFANTATRIAMQNAVNSMTANPGNNEKRDDTTPIVQNGENIYYTKTAFPTGSMTILSVNYYDTYPTLPAGAEVPSSVIGQNTLKQPGQSTSSKNTKSLPLASYVRNIEDNNWTKNYNYYDEKGRAIGTSSINHLGGYTKTESELDFVGLAKQTRVYHKRLISDTEKVITQTFTYDSQNRMIIHKHKVDNNPEEVLAQNEYNELSQLKNKKVGGTDTASPLQSIDYTYNIRGWLTRINDPSNLNGKLFGYEMRYTNPINTQVAPGRFNGNITEVDWNNASENVLKRYNYSYDNLNRLQDAIYSEPNATNPFNNNFNENLTYDLNGNIKTLKRNAFPITGNTATQVDDLVYNYTGNRLNRVVENALNTTGYEGGNNLIDYDLNGNMINMKDKGIQSINYNYLNLPNQLNISHSGGNLGFNFNISINHLYRADGTKLRKTYYSARSGDVGTTTTTDYLDGFQYRLFDNGMGTLCLSCKTNSAYEEQAYKAASIPLPGKPVWTLDFVATAEGFYSFTENRYIYQYNDHLGNTRVSFAKNSAGVLQTIDTNNYYPFGLNHIGGTQSSKFTSFYSYKYNGKELQETGFFDYGWRQYMPDLGRWNSMDQLSEKYLSTSPFAYVAGNPVSRFDVDGRWFREDGSIDTSGRTPGFMGGSYKPFYATGYPEQGNVGNGNYTAFGKTQAYTDIMTAFRNGGTAELVNQNGTLKWWTDYDDPNTGIKGVGQLNMLKFTENSSVWGNQIQSHFSSYTENSFNWIQNHPREVTSIAGIIQASSTITEKGLSNWNASSSIAKSRIFAETISTKLPVSAKALGNASKVLGVAGKAVGVLGIANTVYQWNKGNISDTRAIVDGVMGVAGFFPATAWVSIGYFAGMTIYETYYNNGKPAF